MEELKKCSVCGEEARRYIDNGGDFPEERIDCVRGCHIGIAHDEEEWQSRPLEDALRAKLDELQKRYDLMMDAWAVDETIQGDGSLRPSIYDTVVRANIADNKCNVLQRKLDEVQMMLETIKKERDESELRFVELETALETLEKLTRLNVIICASI